MANPAVPRFNRRFIDKVNRWHKYSYPDAPDLTEDEVRSFYRTDDYVTFYDLGPNPPPIVRGPPGPIVVPFQQPLSPNEQRFLDQQIPGLEPKKALWKGIKCLGQGGFVWVGMWQYNGPDDQTPWFTTVAVKELTPDQSKFDLEREARIMQKLNKSRSDHIVALLADPRIVDAIAEGLGPEWDGRIRRLIMEYCDQGTAGDLIERRFERNLSFSETSLWLMFNCLVDGISVMDSGAEAKRATATGEIVVFGQPDWTPVVHFDLKPDNVLLGRPVIDHRFMPILKISDFGSAHEIPPLGRKGDNLRSFNERVRERGTPWYFAPEQFTERWNFADWDTSGVAGVYGSATNVWGIGCIMHNLVMLSEIGPDPTQPFTPRSINDAAPKCRTFGYDMQSAAYSNSLKDLIFECLYEVPAERPSIIELKERVGFGYDVAINSNEANDRSEPWEDFEMPEPDPFPPQEWLAQHSDTGSSQSLSAGTPRLLVPAKVGSQHLTSAQPPLVVSGAGHPANARPIPPPSVGQDFGPPSVGQPLPNQYAQPTAEGAAGGDHLDVALQSALDYFLFTFQQYRERATNDKQQLKEAKARNKPNTRSTGQTPPPPAAAFMHEKAQPTAPVRNFQQAAAVQPTAEEQQALNDIMNCLARYRK